MSSVTRSCSMHRITSPASNRIRLNFQFTINSHHSVRMENVPKRRKNIVVNVDSFCRPCGVQGDILLVCRIRVRLHSINFTQHFQHSSSLDGTKKPKTKEWFNTSESTREIFHNLQILIRVSSKIKRKLDRDIRGKIYFHHEFFRTYEAEIENKVRVKNLLDVM